MVNCLSYEISRQRKATNMIKYADNPQYVETELFVFIRIIYLHGLAAYLVPAAMPLFR